MIVTDTFDSSHPLVMDSNPGRRRKFFHSKNGFQKIAKWFIFCPQSFCISSVKDANTKDNKTEPGKWKKTFWTLVHLLFLLLLLLLLLFVHRLTLCAKPALEAKAAYQCLDNKKWNKRVPILPFCGFTQWPSLMADSMTTITLVKHMRWKKLQIMLCNIINIALKITTFWQDCHFYKADWFIIKMVNGK